MSFWDKVADVATVGLYGAATGKGFDITGKGAAADALKSSQAAQQDAASRSLALQERMYNESVDRNKPFYDTGVAANRKRDAMINGTYDVQESPAGRYMLQQGSRSLNRQLAARGLLGSGNAAQRLAELSTGVAANDFNSQYQRLSDQVNTGTGVAQQSNNASQNLSAQGSNTLQNSANATQNNNTARAQLYTSMSPLAIGADVLGAVGSAATGLGALNKLNTTPKAAGGL